MEVATIHKEPVPQQAKGTTKWSRVLIVDDSAVVRAGLSALITAHGWVCDTACNGPKAMDLVDENAGRYCFALIDYNLGEDSMHGPTIAREIRKIDTRMCMYGFTSYHDAKTMSEYNEAGVDKVFTKPLTRAQVDELVEYVEQILKWNMNERN